VTEDRKQYVLASARDGANGDDELEQRRAESGNLANCLKNGNRADKVMVNKQCLAFDFVNFVDVTNVVDVVILVLMLNNHRKKPMLPDQMTSDH
jgi:hypothetical protein